MIEPVEMQDFFITFFASAMVILMGALYALFYTFYNLKKIKILNFLAYVSYAILFISVLILTETMHLDKGWQAITMIMIVGYFIAPRWIWYLCVETHKEKTYE